MSFAIMSSRREVDLIEGENFYGIYRGNEFRVHSFDAASNTVSSLFRDDSFPPLPFCPPSVPFPPLPYPGKVATRCRIEDLNHRPLNSREPKKKKKKKEEKKKKKKKKKKKNLERNRAVTCSTRARRSSS